MSNGCGYMVARNQTLEAQLTVSWRAHFPRITWDLHSALGFWCLPFVLLWGISGIDLSLPQSFNVLFLIDHRDSDNSVEP
ncbi:MAG: PepSY domain-containing protein [Bryobacteraceae bacterium]